MNNRGQGGRPELGRSLNNPRQNAGGYNRAANQPNKPPSPPAPHYPFNHEHAESVLGGMGQPKGDGFNFSLWHQKLVPYRIENNNNSGKNEIKAYKGNSDNAHVYYKNVYSKVKGGAKDALKELHMNQSALIRQPLPGLVGVEIEAKLISSLLTGIGAPHLSETNLYLDRNLGLPAIPASSIKGIVRLGHILERLAENPKWAEKDTVKDYEIDLLPELFGIASEDAVKFKKNGKEWGRGRVVFLDAYPKEVPDLKADILNPHYPKYYREGVKDWPRDNQDPIPVTFLTVDTGTVFCFRFLAPEGLCEPLKAAVTRILTQEGIGAKTSLGYGRFEVKESVVHDPIKAAALEKERKEKEAALELERLEREAVLAREKAASLRSGIILELKAHKDNPGANIDLLVKKIEASTELKADQELEALCREWFTPFPKKKDKVNGRYKALARVYGWEIPEVHKP